MPLPYGARRFGQYTYATRKMPRGGRMIRPGGLGLTTGEIGVVYFSVGRFPTRRETTRLDRSRSGWSSAGPGIVPHPPQPWMRAPWIDASSWWTIANWSASSFLNCLPFPTAGSRWPTTARPPWNGWSSETSRWCLTDLCLPGIGGLDLIREIRQRDLPVTVIVMTGHASIDSAVAAMKLGAYDYLLKPIDSVRLERPRRAGARGPQAPG